MADVQSHRSQPRGSGGPAAASSSILRRFQENKPTSAQLVGLLTLVVSGGILLLLTGLTLTASILSLIFFTPLIIISSPVWIPVGSLLFLAVAGFLSVCGLGIAAAITISWLYRYLNGFHPPGSDRIDYARSRIVDTANHVKDYAGGYLHGKAKDAAPSA